MPSKSNVGASASRFSRAPSRSTNEIPIRAVTVRCVSVSNVTQPPAPSPSGLKVPVEANGRENFATK
jgi:hypothetical protein